MEPAVKPAAADTRSGVVGVLATPATFQGDLYASTVERFARGVKILQDTCPGLVKQIEEGKINHPQTREILEKALKPMLLEGVDEVVMGCTHYPFVIPLIKDIIGDRAKVIDPSPAVARQAGRILEEYDLLAPDDGPGDLVFLTTGDPTKLEGMVKSLLDLRSTVNQLDWEGGLIIEG
jgi:glutamate racemase